MDVEVYHQQPLHPLERLAARVRPHLEQIGARRAIVFGSYARGCADRWSDLDLVVVMDTDLPFAERGKLFLPMIRDLPVAVDLLVYTPEEYERGVATQLGLFDCLAHEGKAIYESRR